MFLIMIYLNQVKIVNTVNGEKKQNPSVKEYYWFKSDNLSDEINSELKKNLEKLPYFLSSIKIANYNLYSIYSEAYRIIAFGFYNAGILLLSQLLETTLREIVYVNTGIYRKGTFGSLIKNVKDKKIIDKYSIIRLEYFKNKIRNPYIHRDLNEIVKDIYVPTWPIYFKKDAKNPLKKIETAKKEINEGNRKPIFIPASLDSTVATIIKEKIDERRTIGLAWDVFSEFEILIDMYLKPEDYQNHIKKHGSPFDVISNKDIK